jgi:hypothetical protein
MPPDANSIRRTAGRAFWLAHIVASYVAGPVFVALEVFYYRPIHWSPPTARASAAVMAAVSPLTAPMLLVGTPVGIALHHGPSRPLWFVVGAGYIVLEAVLFRLFRRSRSPEVA